MFDAMQLLNDVVLAAPVKVGDIVIKDLFGTGIDFVACKNIAE